MRTYKHAPVISIINKNKPIVSLSTIQTKKPLIK